MNPITWPLFHGLALLVAATALLLSVWRGRFGYHRSRPSHGRRSARVSRYGRAARRQWHRF